MKKEPGRGLLYLKISEILKNEMDEGMILPGEQLPGVRLLAARFETSVKTISRVLDELEASGRIERTQGRGIFATPRGKGGLSGSGPWGCLCASRDAGADELIRALEEEAGHEGRELLIRKYDRMIESPELLVRGMKENGAEGVFVISSCFPLESFSESDIPCLLLGGTGSDPSPSGVSSILWDLAGGIDTAVGHLASGGHLVLGFIEDAAGEASQSASRSDTGAGASFFKAALAKRGMDYSSARILTMRAEDSGGVELAVRKLLMRDAEVTAIVCMHDRLAAGVIRAASEAGLTVPEDLCVTGFGGTELGEATVPSLTTLAFDSSAMAAAALACMAHITRGAGRLKIRLLQPLDLIIRESSVNRAYELDDRWV